MSFEFEREMHTALLRIAAEFIDDADDWAVALELPGPYRIPDLVLARLDAQAVAMRVESSLSAALHGAEVKALLSLQHRRWTDVEDASILMGIGPRHARRTLRLLADRGYVETRPGRPSQFRRRAEARFITSRIVSFEAKLRDWRTALVQSRAHQRFANASYVVFDRTYESRFLAARAQFRAANVGLVAVSSETGVHERILASRVRPRDPEAVAFVGESLLAALTDRAVRSSRESRLPGAAARIGDREQPKLAGPRAKSLMRQLAAAVLL